MGCGRVRAFFRLGPRRSRDHKCGFLVETRTARCTASCPHPFAVTLYAAASKNKLHRQLDDSHVAVCPSDLAEIRFSFEVGIWVSKMRRVGGIESLQPCLQFERLLDLELLE